MLEDITKKLIKNIVFVKEYCVRNRMILVRVDVPPCIYNALKERYHNLKQLDIVSHFAIEQLCGASIGLSRDIKKPQYIIEMNDNDL